MADAAAPPPNLQLYVRGKGISELRNLDDGFNTAPVPGFEGKADDATLAEYSVRAETLPLSLSFSPSAMPCC